MIDVSKHCEQATPSKAHAGQTKYEGDVGPDGRLLLLYCIHEPVKEHTHQAKTQGRTEGRDAPIQSFLQALSLRRTAAAYAPLPFFLTACEAKLLADGLRRRRPLHVLLIAEDEEGYASELLLGEHGKQLGT